MTVTPGLYGTLLDRYPELDPRGDEAVAAAEPLPGPSTDLSYDGDNGEKFDIDSHLWRKKCFHESEEKLDRGITTLIMNLATLVTDMDDLKDLADSMHLPGRIATLLVTTYKLVMVTMLQLYTSYSYHMLIVWYWSEMGDEFCKLYNLQKLFDFLGLGSKSVNIMSCHGCGPVGTGMRNLLRSRRLISWDDRAPPHLDGQGGPNEQNALQETSLSGLSQSSRENGENMVDGEVSTTKNTPRLKIAKSVSFEYSDLSENQQPDTERHSTVAGLQVKVFEKDIDDTIRWVKVTYTESE